MTQAEDRAEDRPARWPWIVLAVAVALVLGGGGFFVVGNLSESDRADTQTDRADTAEAVAVDAGEKKDDVVDAATPICQRPQLDAALTRLCAEVQEAREDPDPVPLPVAEVDYRRVRGLVDDALDQDPRLSESALLALVQQVYRSDPPAAGKTPTPAELLGLIRQVYAADPPEPGADGQPGQDGADGQDGQAGRDGVDGQPGAQGISVVGFGFERTADGCVLAQVLENPATGERQTIRLPVPEEFCGSGEPDPDGPLVPGGLVPGN